MKRDLLLLITLSLALILASCSDESDSTLEGVEGSGTSRDLTVLVGGGQGSSAINAYFPSAVRIRAGDTVTWRMNTEGDPHTVSFGDAETLRAIGDVIRVPGSGPTDRIWNPDILFPTRKPGDPIETYDGNGYVNSGTFFPKNMYPDPMGPDVQLIDTFSLRFETPGAYLYSCQIHPFIHNGVVTVEPVTATDVPSQAEIDAQAQKELGPELEFTDGIQNLVASGRMQDREPNPDGSSTWLVSAGIGRPQAEVLEFMPKTLTVEEGDSVVWVSSRFHAVVFDPGRPPPFFYLPTPQPDALPLVYLNPDVLFPFMASPEFDGSQFYSSGLIGHGSRPGGIGVSLTFTKPGTYVYTCPIHINAGMVGTVTVVAR